LGAAAGCAIGRHEANKHDRMERNQIDNLTAICEMERSASSAIAGY
jgi:hypothetical protein